MKVNRTICRVGKEQDQDQEEQADENEQNELSGSALWS